MHKITWDPNTTLSFKKKLMGQFQEKFWTGGKDGKTEGGKD